MNYFEIIKKVAVCPGINLKEPQVFDTIDPQVKKIKIAVNQALKSICCCWDWKFKIKSYSFDITAGTSNYSFNKGKIINVIYNLDSVISQVLAYDSSLKRGFSAGVPDRYGLSSNNIVLSPVPTESGTITVYYFTDKFALSADLSTEKSELEFATDVPVIPEKYQDLIVHKAVMNYFAKPSKKEYAFYLAQYCERLVQAKSEDRGTKEEFSSVELYGRSQFTRRFGRV